jgi:hypothetical protein
MGNTLLQNTLQKVKRNRIFIETGTYDAGGVIAAVTCGFDLIYTIEIVRWLYEQSRSRTYRPSNAGITFLLGDSAQILPDLLKTIYEPCTFWLDAHFPSEHCPHSTGWDNCPVLLELKTIANHAIKNHVILIDDIPDFKSGVCDAITVDQLTDGIKAINPSYVITYEDGGRGPGTVLAALPM